MAETFQLVIELDGRKVTAQAKKVDKGMSAVSKGVAKASALLAVFGLGFSVKAIIDGLKSLLITVVSISAEFQQLKVSLETVLGSADEATAAFKRLQTFSARTPFQLNELTRGYTQLVARGFEPTGRAMTSIGNIAAGMGKTFDQALNAITQAAFGETESIKSFGVLMKQEIDTVKVRFRGMETEIDRDVNAIFNHLLGIAEANFAGGMERQAETFNGAVSTMRDNVKLLADEIGKELLPAAVTAVKAITDVTVALRENIPAVTLFIAKWGRGLELLTDVGPFRGVIAKAAELTKGMLALGSEVQVVAAERFDPLAVSLDATSKELIRIDNATAALTKRNADLAQSFANLKIDQIKRQYQELRDTLKEVVEQFEATSEAMSAPILRGTTGPADFDFGGMIDSLTAEIPAVANVLGNAVEERVELGLLNAQDSFWQMMAASAKEWGATFKEIMTEALLGATQTGANFAKKAYFDGFNRADVQALGAELGSTFGQALGFAAAGPFGAIIGEALGAIVGDIIGGALASIGDSGPETGTLNFGAGGNSVTTQFQVGGLLEAMEFMREQIRQINQIVGGGVELTQQVAIHIDDTGAVWVDIVDSMGNIVRTLGGFGTLAEAAEAALVHLLKTADLSADMKQAFQDLLGNASDLGQLFADLQFIEQLPKGLNRLAGGARAAAQALRDQFADFERLRQQIERMGLSADATAEAIADVDKAQAAFERTLKASLIGQLGSLAEQLGVSSRLTVRAKILETKLTFRMLKAQLIVADLWDKNADLWRELFRLAKQDARQAVGLLADGVRNAFGGGGTVKFPDQVGVKAAEILPVKEQGGTGISPESQMLAAFVALRSGFEVSVETPLESLNREFNEWTRTFEGINWGDATREAAAFNLLLEQYAITLALILDSMKQSLQAFRDSLDLSEEFSQGTRRERADAALLDFQDLLAAAMGGDAAAFLQLEDAAALALQLGEEAFGGSTQAFQDIFSLITGGLDDILGMDFDDLFGGTDPLADPISMIPASMDNLQTTMDLQTLAVVSAIEEDEQTTSGWLWVVNNSLVRIESRLNTGVKALPV